MRPIETNFNASAILQLQALFSPAEKLADFAFIEDEAHAKQTIMEVLSGEILS